MQENISEEIPESRALSLWRFADAVPVAASDEVARSELGNMIHAWLTLWFGMSREKREREQSSGRWMERRRAFCALWNEQTPIWPDAESWLDKAAERLCEEVEKRWEPARTRREGDRLVWRTEWPLEVCRETPEGELRRTMRVDMLVELRHEDGTCGPCLIIDHKCGDYARFATDEALLKHLQEAYAVQMAGYLQAFADMGREWPVLDASSSGRQDAGVFSPVGGDGMTRLYLDVDGVLLTVRRKRAAPGVAEFVAEATRLFDCFWLTTHCRSLEDLPWIRYYLGSFCLRTSFPRLRRASGPQRGRR